jgi:hypothetical protein
LRPRSELLFIGPKVIGEIAERLQHQTTGPARSGFLNDRQKGRFQSLLAFEIVVARIVIRPFYQRHE